MKKTIRILAVITIIAIISCCIGCGEKEKLGIEANEVPNKALSIVKARLYTQGGAYYGLRGTDKDKTTVTIESTDNSGTRYTVVMKHTDLTGNYVYNRFTAIYDKASDGTYVLTDIEIKNY